MTPTLTQLIWRVLVPVLAVDQMLKIWVKTSFTYGESMGFVPGLLELRFIENPGAAFGAALPGETGKLVLTSFRIVAAIAIGLYIARRVREEAPNGLLYTLTFIWAGAIGNIVDSVFYGKVFSASEYTFHSSKLAEWMPESGGYGPWFQGKVVDMFHFVVEWPSWFPIESWAGKEVFPPIWNLADAAIAVSVIWILIKQRSYFPTIR